MVVWDNKTRNPLYTIEKLHASDFPKANPKNTSSPKNANNSSLVFWENAQEENGKNEGHKGNRPPFFAESTVQTPFRVNPKDYNDSRLDRGHLVPAADFSHCDVLYRRTFSMANIAPQAPLLNRGIWERLESWIRYYLLQYHFEEVVVVTGPVFAPVFLDNQWLYLNRTLGAFPNLITVPTHFYKVILGRTSASGSTKQDVVVAAFLLPNHNHVDKMEPVANLLVRLDQLEAMVGYSFFTALLDDQDKAKLDTAVPSYRDLTVLLNAQQQLASNNKSSSGSTSVGEAIAQLTAGGNAGSSSPSSGNGHQVKKNLNYSNAQLKAGHISAQSGLKVRHLCGQGKIDCNLTMFP
jgi:DNA/RNA endonuclease G (NUC1)